MNVAGEESKAVKSRVAIGEASVCSGRRDHEHILGKVQNADVAGAGTDEKRTCTKAIWGK